MYVNILISMDNYQLQMAMNQSYIQTNHIITGANYTKYLKLSNRKKKEYVYLTYTLTVKWVLEQDVLMQKKRTIHFFFVIGHIECNICSDSWVSNQFSDIIVKKLKIGSFDLFVICQRRNKSICFI